jgi:hypothetical protein
LGTFIRFPFFQVRVCWTQLENLQVISLAKNARLFLYLPLSYLLKYIKNAKLSQNSATSEQGPQPMNQSFKSLRYNGTHFRRRLTSSFMEGMIRSSRQKHFYPLEAVQCVEGYGYILDHFEMNCKDVIICAEHELTNPTLIPYIPVSMSTDLHLLNFLSRYW